ncbi:MAG: exosortase Q [Azonexus sp.]|nr:exosortase Q [Azonexus sp.]
MSFALLAPNHPRLIDWSIQLDRAPAAGWLALQMAALTPHWLWMARRMTDGSDDPLGLLALAALAALVWTLRRELRPAPRLGWLALATTGTLAAAALRVGSGPLPALPPLAAALVAVLALASGLLAFLPRRVAAPPVALLAVLALPLLSSLQFYAGYPLRVITAEASRWLLMIGFDTARAGSSLVIDGQLVIVDAPCSGVQMAWFGYFTASLAALWAGRAGRSFVARLPVVSLLVLGGNIARNAALVALEAVGYAPGWVHQGIGLVALALVCGGVARVMQNPFPAKKEGNPPCRPAWFAKRWLENRFANRVAHKAVFAAVMLLCLIGSAAAWQRGEQALPASASFQEWPSQWEGRPLRPLALGEVERRFAEHFPGSIARFTDDRRMFVMRRVDKPTRMLHPATDCYRALGYRIAQERLEQDAETRRWRCFVAERHGGRKLRVCERIVDTEGAAFTDASDWYWAAISGRSHGPWQAVTLAQPIE